MIRYTRETHRLHPRQKPTYIIASPEEDVLTMQKGSSGTTTFRGEAINALGQYEDIGTLEEVRQAMEAFQTKK